ncbi:MAG: choice-of-anchor tandem repeat GloVer-containing protein [Limisphaerales bacterium]
MLAQTAQYRTIQSFGVAGAVGQKPYAGVVSGTDGALYGTTLGGGSNSAGTVFKVNMDGSGYATLHTFETNGVDGESPGALIQASDGALYGMTSIGGTNRAGTIYTLNRDGSGYQLLHVFGSVAADGGNPGAGLSEGSDGGLYGTAFWGGSNGLGTVFRLNKDGSSYGALYHFGQSASDGANPDTAVVQGADGALYGTTFFGGTNDAGTVFNLNTNGGGYGVLRMFSKSGGDGQNPDAALMQASTGALYGTTYSGGASNAGTVFTLGTNGGGYNILHSFKSFAGDAQSPLGALFEGKDGLLYGTTYSGGSNGVGAIFKLTQAGTDYSVWRGFLSSGDDGQNPRGGLVLGNDGAFYGTTWDGGQSGVGTVYQIYPPETPAMLGAVMARNTAQVWFSGVSGYQYQVLRSTDLVNWAGLGTVSMPVSGVCTNVDAAAPMAGAFYRAAWVP